MSEYVKDTSTPSGWKIVSHKQAGDKDDGAPLTAEGMDEEATGVSGDEQPDTEMD